MGKDDCMRLLFRQPPVALRPNGRGCWQVRARLVKKVRTQARLVVLALLRKEPERWTGFVPVRYDVTWFYWGGTGPDADNALASCKAYLDGCCDALGVNDRVLDCAGIHRVKDREQYGTVLIRFYGFRKETE